MDLGDHFPDVPPPVLIAAAKHYEAVFFDVPIEAWERTGSFMARWVEGVRIGFAPRQKYASIHFQTGEATELYRMLGGTCPAARVTINLPYGEAVDAERIRHVIDRVVAAGPRSARASTSR
ncbi:MAG: hypothetical protein RMA76_41325 [Deltaproteobacteria bacterium]|jgi:hypothetical protein